MNSYKFDAGQTFREAQKMLHEINGLENRDYIAKLTWLEGNQAQQTLTFLWDPLAERFGHQIDKKPIDKEIVFALLNDIAVEVELHSSKRPSRNG